MIQVNGKNHAWQEGLTVEKLIEFKRYVHPHKVVHINGVLIHEEEYASTLINLGDDVKIIHLMAGG